MVFFSARSLILYVKLSFIFLYCYVLVIGVAFIQFPTTILRLINKQWYRSTQKPIKNIFGMILVHKISLFGSMKFFVTGDIGAFSRPSFLGEASILISNHQTYSDGSFLFILMYLLGKCQYARYIHCDGMMKFPFMKKICQHFEFIPISRNWESDKKVIDEGLQNIRDGGTLPSFLTMFPEGHILCQESREKMLKYRHEKGIPQSFNHVLYPRNNGLYRCVEVLHDRMTYIYDITIALSGIPDDKYAFDLHGALEAVQDPYLKELHIHIRAFNIKEVPVEKESFKEWLFGVWAEKNWILNFFRQFGTFDGCDYALDKAKGELNARTDGTLLYKNVDVPPDDTHTRITILPVKPFARDLTLFILGCALPFLILPWFILRVYLILFILYGFI